MSNELKPFSTAMYHPKKAQMHEAATGLLALTTTSPSGLIETKESDLGFQFLCAYATILHAHRYHI